MIALSDKNPADNPGFIFVGDHPAIDFANTQSMSQGQSIDHLRVWDDVIDWLSSRGDIDGSRPADSNFPQLGSGQKRGGVSPGLES